MNVKPWRFSDVTKGYSLLYCSWWQQPKPSRWYCPLTPCAFQTHWALQRVLLPATNRGLKKCCFSGDFLVKKRKIGSITDRVWLFHQSLRWKMNLWNWLRYGTFRQSRHSAANWRFSSDKTENAQKRLFRINHQQSHRFPFQLKNNTK